MYRNNVLSSLKVSKKKEKEIFRIRKYTNYSALVKVGGFLMFK